MAASRGAHERVQANAGYCYMLFQQVISRTWGEGSKHFILGIVAVMRCHI